MSTKLGAAYSLHKPFRPRDLLTAIEACVKQGSTVSPRREPQSIGGAGHG
jgi:DNA-binding response OmpR family regulator